METRLITYLFLYVTRLRLRIFRSLYSPCELELSVICVRDKWPVGLEMEIKAF